MAGRKLGEFQDDRLSQALALIARMDHDVAQIRAIEAIGDGAARGDQCAAVEDEALEHAVGKDALQVLRRLIAQRGDSIQLRHLDPVDGTLLV